MRDAYIQGFNEGYVLAEHLPDLAQQLSHIDSVSSRMEGFRAGRKQYALENTKTIYPSWLWSADRGPSRTKPQRDRDHGKGEDGRELES